MGTELSKDNLTSFNSRRSGATTKETNMLNYSYFLGGTDVTNSALSQYDLARTGYGRLFITRMPAYMKALLPGATQKVKHLLEFANVGIDGIQGYSVDFASITAGYSGNTIEIPTNSKDDTNSLSIKIYETSASLIRSYFDTWITGVIDPYTGLTHYHGAMDLADSGIKSVSQANHTMEAIYVATDPTGTEVMYSCLLANMFPKASDHSAFVYEPGTHDLMQLSYEFTATKYMSSQIDAVAKTLLDNFKILRNYLNFTTNSVPTADGSNGSPNSTSLQDKVWTDDQLTSYASDDKDVFK